MYYNYIVRKFRFDSTITYGMEAWNLRGRTIATIRNHNTPFLFLSLFQYVSLTKTHNVYNSIEKNVDLFYHKQVNRCLKLGLPYPNIWLYILVDFTMGNSRYQTNLIWNKAVESLACLT